MSSTLRVNTITNITGDGAVDFPKGITGDGSNLNFDPKIIGHTPNFFGTNVPIETNITLTFNQNIKFWGSGTIEIREGSSSGTVAFSFSITNNTGGSGLQIVNEKLVITPPSSLSYNKTYFVVIPSAGIAGQTSEIYFAGDNTYSFQTLTSAFLMSGGSHEFVVYNTSSPTNYYKYHIFTGTSSFTLANPSSSATDFALMMVAGGGGGGGYPSSYQGGGGGGAGGLIQRSGPTLGLPSGTYNMTIGAGGFGWDNPFPQQPTYHNQTYSQQGFDTAITPPTQPTTYLLRAYGGGAGGSYYGYYTNTGSNVSNPQGAGPGGPGGSGGGAYSHWNVSNVQPPVSVGGPSVSGQGYPGGGNTFYQPPGNASVGGGGGGAGGAGGRANANGTNQPTSTYWYAGHGGPGLSVPNFPFIDIFSGGIVPTPDFPMESQQRTNGTFAGGGGGGAGPSSGTSGTYRGKGGPGGGGTGGGSQNPSEPDYPSPPGNPQSDQYGNPGAKASGGGGGGARESSPSYHAGNGGSGVAMIRYAYPAALV